MTTRLLTIVFIGMIIGMIVMSISIAFSKSMTITHLDGTKTILSCRTGSTLVACRHSDLLLFQ